MTTHPHVELRINKEQSCNSTAFLYFHSLFEGNISPFTFSLEKHKDTDSCEYRRNCTLCEQKRTRRSLGCGRDEGVGSPQTWQASFCSTVAELLEASPRGIDHSANVCQLSLFCGIRSFATSIWHTRTASKETSGGISRTGAVQVIIFDRFAQR